MTCQTQVQLAVMGHRTLGAERPVQHKERSVTLFFSGKRLADLWTSWIVFILLHLVHESSLAHLNI